MFAGDDDGDDDDRGDDDDGDMGGGQLQQAPGLLLSHSPLTGRTNPSITAK